MYCWSWGDVTGPIVVCLPAFAFLMNPTASFKILIDASFTESRGFSFIYTVSAPNVFRNKKVFVAKFLTAAL